MVVKKASVETSDRMLRTLELAFVNEEDEKAFDIPPVNSANSRSLERARLPLELPLLPRKRAP